MTPYEQARAQALELCDEAVQRAAHTGLAPNDVALTLLSNGGVATFTLKQCLAALAQR